MWSRVWVDRDSASRAILGTLACCAVMAAMMPVSRAAGDQVGKVASLQNQVETKGSTANTWEPSTLHQSLFERDRVRTGAESRAAILYSDQTLHRINAKSEIEVRSRKPVVSPGELGREVEGPDVRHRESGERGQLRERVSPDRESEIDSARLEGRFDLALDTDYGPTRAKLQRNTERCAGQNTSQPLEFPVELDRLVSIMRFDLELERRGMTSLPHSNAIDDDIVRFPSGAVTVGNARILHHRASQQCGERRTRLVFDLFG